MPKTAINRNDVRIADLSLLDFLKEAYTVSGKIGVFDNLEGLDISGYFNLNGLVLLIVEKGTCSMEIDLNIYNLRRGDILVALPGQIIRMREFSQDLKPLVIAATVDMVNEIRPLVKNSTQYLLMTQKSPFQRWERRYFEQIVRSFQMLKEKMKVAKNNRFFYQIVQGHVVSIVYECLGFWLDKNSVTPITNRKESLFDAFLQMVVERHKTEHSVTYYARELFVTPKYLSTIVSEISGKGAKQWIEEYIALDAKFLLQSSRKEIQEISDELNFSDVGNFGKFFRRMTGKSPKAFRMNK